jgi:hypothetical protein
VGYFPVLVYFNEKNLATLVNGLVTHGIVILTIQTPRMSENNFWAIFFLIAFVIDAFSDLFWLGGTAHAQKPTRPHTDTPI